jgi:RNA polymerase sigma-70 factor (ECF subfamily)
MEKADFGLLALPHVDALYRMARRLTASAAEAEDLVQQTLLEGMRSFGTLADVQRCRGWLFRILRRTWIEGRKRDGGARLSSLHDETGEEEDCPGGNLEDEILRTSFSDEMESALASLPEGFRTAVLLADVEGFSYQEIAEATGCAVGTVRSRVARGRGLLLGRLKRKSATTPGGGR